MSDRTTQLVQKERLFYLKIYFQKMIIYHNFILLPIAKRYFRLSYAKHVLSYMSSGLVRIPRLNSKILELWLVRTVARPYETSKSGPHCLSLPGCTSRTFLLYVEHVLNIESLAKISVIKCCYSLMILSSWSSLIIGCLMKYLSFHLFYEWNSCSIYLN